MTTMIYDALSYFCEAENAQQVEEGFEGYQILQAKEDDKYIVVFKELDRGKEIDRKYLIDETDLKTFQELYERYSDLFRKNQFLFKIIMEAEFTMRGDLKERTDELYGRDNIHFVAMNMNKTQFYLMAKERIYPKS